MPLTRPRLRPLRLILACIVLLVVSVLQFTPISFGGVGVKPLSLGTSAAGLDPFIPTNLLPAPELEQSYHLGTGACVDACLSHSYLERDGAGHIDSRHRACDGDLDGYNVFSVSYVNSTAYRVWDSDGFGGGCGADNFPGNAYSHQACVKDMWNCGSQSGHPN